MPKQESDYLLRRSSALGAMASGPTDVGPIAATKGSSGPAMPKQLKVRDSLQRRSSALGAVADKGTRDAKSYAPTKGSAPEARATEIYDLSSFSIGEDECPPQECPTPPKATVSASATIAPTPPLVVASPTDSKRYSELCDVLVAGRRLEIEKQQADLRQGAAEAQAQVGELKVNIEKIGQEVAGLHVRADVNKKEALEHQARARELRELHDQRMADKDLKRDQYIAMAEQIGVADPERVLAAVQENPSCVAKGAPKVLQEYGRLLQECTSLREQVSKADRSASTSLAVTSSLELSAVRTEAKQKELQKKLQEKEDAMNKCNDGEEELQNARANLVGNVQDIKDALTWVEQTTLGSMKQTLENMPWIMLMCNQHREQCQTRAMIMASHAQNPSFVADARRRGCTALTMRTAGCSFQELIDAGYSANELRTTGLTPSKLFNEGVAAEKLRDLGYTVAEGLQAGYSSSSMASAYTAQELKEGGITAGLLKSSGMSLNQVHALGYGLQDMHMAGFALEDVLSVLGISSNLPNDIAVLSRRSFVFHGAQDTMQKGEDCNSDLACFDEAPPEHRYCFKIGMRPSENTKDVGVAFIPQAGPETQLDGNTKVRSLIAPEALSWPLKHDIRMRLFCWDGSSPTFTEHRLDMANLPEGAHLLFTEELAPPPANNDLGWIFPMLKKEDLESRKHLFEGSLIVQCELLASSCPSHPALDGELPDLVVPESF